MSSDLLEKECQLQNQNKELQSRTKKVVEEAEKVVRGGKETLNQSTYSAVKDQDNIDNLRSAKKLTPASKFLAKWYGHLKPSFFGTSRLLRSRLTSKLNF